MVRSMICNIDLPKCPSKSVSKTPFELWNKRKPSLNHLHVLGCRAEAKVYNPELAKFDPKTHEGINKDFVFEEEGEIGTEHANVTNQVLALPLNQMSSQTNAPAKPVIHHQEGFSHNKKGVDYTETFS
ncbi:unnamed protein product [Prunus armeniaca]